MLLDSTIPAHDALRFREDHTDGEEMRRFRQRRLALYSGMMGGLFSVLYLAGLLLVLVGSPSRLLEVHLHPSKLGHLAFSVVPLGWSLLLRRRRMDERQLHAIDLGVVLIVSFIVGGGFWYAPAGFHLELGALLLLLMALVLRAAIVPSTSRFTAVVGVASTPPIVAATVHQAQISGLTGLVNPLTMGIGITPTRPRRAARAARGVAS